MSGIKRIGIVGAGGISRAHGNACRQLEDVQIAAVCDIRPEAAERYANDYGAENHYGSLDEMLKAEQFDAAVICVWGAYHAEVGIQIAESKAAKAILCEKPFTSTGAEAAAFVDACEENGVLVAEAFKFRHHPRHMKAKALIDEGAIEELTTVRSTFCIGSRKDARTPGSNWRWTKSQGGGSIYDLACYNIHHARYIFGADPVRVFAAEQPGFEVDDAAYMLFVFPCGGTAQISVGWTSWSAEYIEIGGQGGSMRMDAVWNCGGRATSLHLNGRGRSETFEFEPYDQFALQMRHLLDCLETGETHRIPARNSVGQMNTIDAIFESMKTGRSVEVSKEGAE